jgi:hypothetical protein
MTHITIEREALQTVLDTLEENHHLIEQYERSEYLALYDRQITVIKQALAASEQPIGYVKLIDTPFGEKLKPVLTVAVPVGAKLYTTPPAQPAVPDAFGTREGEHPQYVQGWNDCRAEMLRGMK